MIQRMEMHEFDRLYGEYKPRFILIACSYLRDRSAAEDLVTDCFMHFWEKREEIVPVTENIPAYIYNPQNEALRFSRTKRSLL